MKTKNAFVLLFFILVSMNCSAEYNLKVAYQFEPLKVGEKLNYVVFGQDESPYYIAIIFREKGRGFLYKILQIDTVNYYPKMLDNSTKFIYYINIRSEDRDGRYNTYLLDGKVGKTYFIGKIYPNYDISDDGRYLCYEDDSKKKYIELYKGVRTIPGIVLKDLETGKERIYDFSKTFLKDKWGAGPYIRYIPERNVFSFTFFIEDEIFSKGFINAAGGDYQEYKDVIGLGRINTKDIHLRKNPSIDSEIVTFGYNYPLLLKRRRVDIIGKTQNKVKIGNMYNYWYKIRTFSMHEGWVFGEYITLEK